MNYIVLIISVAIFFGVSDLLTVNYTKIQRDIFYIALGIIYFLFLIRYYYGPDIASYVPYFEKLPKSLKLNDLINGYHEHFEVGYYLLNVIFHTIGLSYWWLTAFITSLYFLAVYLLFKNIPSFRSFALMILVALDYNLIYAENRQCLAVAFFIFAILLFQKKKFLWGLVMMVICVTMHKSAIFIVALSLFYFVLKNWKIPTYLYQLLFAILAILVVLPVSKISTALIAILPLPANYVASLSHHLSLGTQFQLIALIYLITLFCFMYYRLYNNKTRNSWITFISIIGLAIIVVVYQYYFLLNRIRSYFIPFIIVELLRLVCHEREHLHIRYASFLRQITAVIVIMYCIHSAIAFYRMSEKLSCPLNNACTIFNLIDDTPSNIRGHQMQLAEKFWEVDYNKDEKNKLR